MKDERIQGACKGRESSRRAQGAWTTIVGRGDKELNDAFMSDKA